jgi:hypothetical protein
MELLVQRKPSEPDGTSNGMMTIGEMFVNNIFECLTLEDLVRPSGMFVFGATAIPAGRYHVIVDRSDRFSELEGHDVYLPHVLDLDGITTMFGAHSINDAGIRIHPGNDEFDTEGCILVGITQGKVYGKDGIYISDGILQSAIAFNALFPKIEAALKVEPVYLTIQNAGS